MPTTVPAMKGRLGNTDYYILSMKAQELVNNVKIPKELDGWDDLSIEERYQREINYARVKKNIAPYLSQNESRFFGAIIVAVQNFTEDSFESLSEMVTKSFPKLYQSAAQDMGFLTFGGGEVMFPLDGQHRLKAIEFAITGRDEKGVDIPQVNPSSQLAKEDVTVILLPYEPRKARHIFTHVNRYAKPTTTGQNIITDDDDFCAVLSREITNDKIGGRLVKYVSNTLNPKNVEFTTLSIIYTCTKKIIEDRFPINSAKSIVNPNPDEQALYRREVHSVWGLILDKIDVFSDALNDQEESGDSRRQEIRKTNLLGKPVVQECLIKAFLSLTNNEKDGLSDEDACERLNALPWNITEENTEIWDRVLWIGGMSGRIITKNRELTTNFMLYFAGSDFYESKPGLLKDVYLKQFPDSERSSKNLPSRTV